MRPLVLAVLASLMAVPPVTAECVPTTTTPELEAAGHYFLLDTCRGETCWWDVWIYEESNGIPGLQRRDEFRDDTCAGKIAGDTVVL